MTKKQLSVLGFESTDLVDSFGSSTSLAPLNANHKPTYNEQGIVEHTRTQELAIEAYQAKARFAVSKLQDVYEHATVTFDDTSRFITETKERAGRSQSHQACADEWCGRLVSTAAKQMMGVAEVSGYRIGEEVHRSVYPPEQEKPRGFFAWLRGE